MIMEMKIHHPKEDWNLTSQGWTVLFLVAILVGVSLAIIFAPKFQQMKDGGTTEQIRYDIPTPNRPIIK
jgi:hypothetical protein